jgi:hypothetical protein
MLYHDTSSHILVTSDLSFRDRSDPTQSQVDTDGYYTNDPENLGVVGTIVSENDGEDNTTKIAGSSSASRDDT